MALLPVINEKCDIIIHLLSSLCDNPDFLIDLLRKTTEKQNKFSSSRMEKYCMDMGLEQIVIERISVDIGTGKKVLQEYDGRRRPCRRDCV